MASHNRYGAGRRFEIRPVLPVITVVCDDTKAAIAYFDLLKQEVKESRTVFVYPAPHCGANAKDVMEFAKDNLPKSVEAADQTFVLIDLDTNPNETGIRQMAADAGIQVAFSQPCYEVWTLAHLEDTGEHFINCYAVVKRIAEAWKRVFHQKFGAKSQADYSKLMPTRDRAIERCRRRDSTTSQSWTEVWRVVEVIIA